MKFFISYSHEDKDIVRDMGRVFDDAGNPYFLDEKDVSSDLLIYGNSR